MTIKKILHSHPTFIHANDIEEICNPLKPLGIEYFSHVIVDNSGNFSAIGCCPQFAELYFKKEYYNFDIHNSSLHQGQKYTIWDNVPRDPKLNEIYDDFKSFSLGHSFTIAFQDTRGCKHYYDFSARLGNHNINQNYLRHLNSLKMFILYFNEQINTNRELKKAYDIKFSITNQSENILQEKNPDKLSFPISRIYFSPDIYLTVRELQCLHWLNQSKTLEEISMILSVSLRTVKAHIGNIKIKLDCNNLFQLGLAYQTLKEIHGQNLNLISE